MRTRSVVAGLAVMQAMWFFPVAGHAQSCGPVDCAILQASAIGDIQLLGDTVYGELSYTGNYTEEYGIVHCGLYPSDWGISPTYKEYPKPGAPYSGVEHTWGPPTCERQEQCQDRSNMRGEFSQTINPGTYYFRVGTPWCTLLGKLVFLPPDEWDAPPCETCVGSSPTTCVHPTPGRSLVVSARPDLTLASPLGDRTIERTYRTSLVGDAAGGDGMFGRGWRANFEYQVAALEGNASYGVMLFDAQGRKIFYHRDYSVSSEVYLSPDGNGGSITKNSDGTYVWVDAQGTSYGFNVNGRIVSITDVHGQQELIEYDTTGTHVTRLTDRHDRVLTFDYQGTSHVKRLLGPKEDANPTWEYAAFAHDTYGNLTAVSYPDGNSLTYEYTNSAWPNHMTRYSMNGPGGTALLQEVQYDNQGRVEVVSEGSGGRSYQLGYSSEQVYFDPDHQELGAKTLYHTTVTEQLNGEPVVRTYYYEKLGGAYVITKTEACDNSCAAEKKYDSAYRVVESKDNRSVTSLMTYNSNGDLTSRTEAAGTADEGYTSYDYVYSQSPVYPGQILERTTRQTSVVVAGGEKTITESYDPATGKLLLHREQGYLIDGSLATYDTAYTYTALGAIETIDGPLSGDIDLTTYSYYSAGGSNGGMLSSIIHPNGAEETFEQYDQLGNILQKTDANGHDTVYAYDSRGRIQAQTTVDGTTLYEHDALGNVTRVTYPKGNSTSYTNGPSGITQVSTTTARIDYGYQNGNKVSERVYRVIDEATAILLKEITFEYDANNRLWRTHQPDGNFEELLYDANGNLTHRDLYSVGQSLERATIHGYDFLNRLQTTTVQTDTTIHQEMAYTYDGHGNLFEVEDPVDQVTRYVYDDFGRQSRVESPETGLTRFTHDPAGNVTVRTDHLSRAITYGVYDGLNRPAGISYSDGTAPVVYRYDTYSDTLPDALGHLTEVTDASGFRRFFYDGAGRVEKVEHIINEGTVDERMFTTEFGYDGNGNLTSLRYPSGRVVRYEFDLVTDLVRKVTATKDGVTTVLADNISHLPFGPIEGFDLGNAAHVTRTFEDRTYRLQSLGVSSPTVLPERVYTYDPVGNIDTITRSGTETHDFGYDPVGRLTSWTEPAHWQTFGYDENGNRQTFDDYGQVTQYFFAAGAPNLLDSSTSGAGVLAYDRDELGNITGWGTKVLHYDINGRLQMALVDGVPTEYVYNVDGQRAKKTAGQATYFEFDSEGRLIHEYRPFEGDYIDYVYLAGEPLAMLTDKYMNRFTVTPSAGDNGSVTPATPQRVDFNQSVVFTVTPDTDYKIEAVTGCSGSLVGDTYTAGPITGDCTVAASFVIKPGHIIVQQVTRPGSVQSFTFTPSYNGGATFTLTNGQSNDSGELLPGTYSVSEASPAGWGLGSATCDDGDSPSAISLLPGQTVTCTFTNLQASMIGTFRNGAWYLDADGSGDWSAAFDTVYASFGVATDLPITGDWDGDGATEIGTFRSGPSYRPWFLDADGSGSWNLQMDTKFESFGLAGDIPITGDWNGDGATEIGVFRNGTWSLDADGSGTWTVGIDIAYAAFGVGSDIPITGDWNDDGRTEIGVFRNGTWYLDNGDGTFSAGSDAVFAFGTAGDIPVSGDWNGDGVTDVGVFRSGNWYLDTDGSRSWSPGIDRILPFGMSSDKPVTGKW